MRWKLALGWRCIQYVYSATANNGQITQMVDAISGETVSYQYDSLKRLTSASAAWTETFQYDGFGNLTGKVLNGASTATLTVEPTTNRLSSASYDANGNMTAGAGATLTYDEANRVVSAAETSGGTEYYGYAPDNKRIYRLEADGVTEEFTFYGAHGERLGVYSLLESQQGWPPTLTFQPLRSSVWFAGTLIWEGNRAVYSDRLGTNKALGAHLYPYGEESTSTANDRTKFATYHRDAFTGLDYADQRFYASTYGRFNSPDPYKPSALAKDPLSWNRYSYTRGDPVNRNDRRGLCDSDDEETGCETWDCNDTREGCDESGSSGEGQQSGGGGGDFSGLTRGRAGAAIIPCADALKGVLNISDFQNKTQGTGSQAKNGDVFWDGTSQSVASMLLSTWGDYHYLNNPDLTTGQYPQNAVAFTSDSPSNNIILGSGYFNPKASDLALFNVSVTQFQDLVLVHEALHAYLGLSDLDLAQKLTGKSQGNPIDASIAISQFLATNCNKNDWK